MKRTILLVILVVALAGAAAYFYGGGQTPPGQPSLEALTAENVTEVRDAFNSAKDNVRVLLLLSPT